MTAYFLAVWTPLQVADCSLARSDHQSAAWLWFVPCWYMAQAACLSEPSVLHIRLNWTGRRCLQLRQWQNNPDWPVEWNGRDGIGPADLPAPSLLALQLFGMGSGTRDKFPKQPVSMITSKSDNSTSVPFKSSPCIVDSRLCQISQALWNEVARTLRPRDSMPDRLAWFSREHSEGSKTASRCQPKSNPLNLNLTHRTHTIHYYSI